jgi:hypothetical protein
MPGLRSWFVLVATLYSSGHFGLHLHSGGWRKSDVSAQDIGNPCFRTAKIAVRYDDFLLQTRVNCLYALSKSLR